MKKDGSMREVLCAAYGSFGLIAAMSLPQGQVVRAAYRSSKELRKMFPPKPGSKGHDDRGKYLDYLQKDGVKKHMPR